MATSLVSNLLQLALVAFLTRLPDQADAVDAHLLRLAVARDDKEDETVDVLELDKPQSNVGRAVGVPVALRQLELLRRRRVLGLVEAQVVRLVAVEPDELGSHRGFVVVVVGRRKRRDLRHQSAGSQRGEAQPERGGFLPGGCAV